MSLRRRQALGLLAASLMPCCKGKRATESRRKPSATQQTNWREFSFEPSAHFRQKEHAVVMLHRGGPLLVALHGAGEAARSTERGARGWRDDYDLDKAHRRLLQPPLKAEDFLGFVRADRLVKLNDSLGQHPYQGLYVACPYTPALRDRSLAGSQGFASFVLHDLIARLQRELAIQPNRLQTGIDGVSMGGRLALLVGLGHPEVFGAVGALQPAVAAREAPWLAQLAARAMSQKPVRLRLVTSDGDYFRDGIEQLSKRLDTDGVKHQLLITPGPHDYVYNRGPGSIEMLQWHDRVLRGLPTV